MNCILTKKDFVDYIEFIKERDEKMEQINNLFTDEFEDSIFYPYFKYEAKFVNLLKTVMHDDGDWIDYFIYERDYGKDLKLGDVTESDGTPIPMSTAEELYDFLINEYFTDKEEK